MILIELDGEKISIEQLASRVTKNLQALQLEAAQKNCNHYFNRKNVCKYCSLDGSF